MLNEFKDFISKGNVMDPLELIDQFGADALRLCEGKIGLAAKGQSVTVVEL